MKKILCVVCSIVLSVALVSFTGCGKTDKSVEKLRAEYSKDLKGTTLNVFNWGEYISTGAEGSLDVVGAFEEATGINVNYLTYDSNEAMYAQLSNDSVAYDIVIPSDYMIERLKNENLLKKLDYSKISNYDLIDARYKSLYFDDKNEYSVPYNVGMIGIIYNKTMVEGKPDSWGLMWDEKYKGDILSFNNSRDAFSTAQFLLGIDVNTTNRADWDAASEKLKEQSPLLQGRVMDQVFDKMESGNAAIAPYYVGDYLTMKEVNPDLEFYFPKEGTNIFVDSICVPTTCKNYDAAMMFINFLLEPEVAIANASEIRYASPNTAVLESDDYELKDNEYIYPKNIDSIKTEYFHDLDADTKDYFEALWKDITISR